MKELWLFIFGIVIYNTKNQASPSTSFTTSNLPIIINTGGKIIMDEPKVTVDMEVIYNGAGLANHVMDPSNNNNGKIALNTKAYLLNHFP